MARAYSYARFSSRAQAEGDSLRRQLSSAYAWAEAHGVELDTTLQDRGVSAYSGANRTKGALRSFLDRVEANEIEQDSYLLLDSMDRLSREMVTTATHQLLGIALAGVNVVTLNDGRVFGRTATMADVMMAVIEIERSHRESAEKGRKVSQAHAQSKRRAREEGRIWHRSGPTWLRFDDARGKFEPIEAKVGPVRRVFDLIEDGLGTAAIAKRYNADGIETPRGGGGGWHHSTVLEIARNRSVIGEYQPKLAPRGYRGSRRPKDGAAVAGYYPAVISEDHFLRVQAILDSRSPRRGRGAGTNKYTNLLIGLGICHECGGKVGIQIASYHPTWKRSSILRCVNSARGLCASKRRHPYEPIEAAILDYIVELQLPGDRPTNNEPAGLTVARAKRDDVAKRVDNLLGLLEEGDAGILARYRERRDELQACEAEIERLNAISRQRQTIKPIADRQVALRDLRKRMSDARPEELYDIRAKLAANLRLIIDWIEFYGRPDIVNENGSIDREDYLLVRLHDDERDYMITPDIILMSDRKRGSQVLRDPYFE